MTSPRRDGAKKIDWDEVRVRLDRAGAALKEALHLPAERARAVLEERARELARVPPAAPRAAEVLELATFTLGKERYAVETRHVREVARLTDYTPVPGAPPFLVGVLNLRGEILALLDLRTFFGVGAKGLTDLARVFVLGAGRAEFGVLADEALEVRTLRIDEVLEPPASVAGIGRDYLKGVTKDALIVLDGAALLQDGRLFIDQGEDGGV